VSKELTASARPAAAPQLGPEARFAVDVALGVAGAGLGAAVSVVRTVHRVTGPVTRWVWDAPLLPSRLRPSTVVGNLSHLGSAERAQMRRQVEVLLDAWVPVLAAALVERLDLTLLVEEHVDLDQLVATVDLDAAVERVDLDAAVERVDLDAVAARLDVDAVVARADLDAVIDRIDLDAVAAKLDVDAVVARADLDAAVRRVNIEAVVDRVDLDAVAAKLDVDAVVARADLDAVIDRIDIVGIIEEVLDVIDLPGIIRDSTGSMASDTVRGVRMTGISADDALTRALERGIFRRRRDHAPGATP
jgi:hypothetical protein